MGIRQLNKFLRRNSPHIFREVSLEEYRHKIIAIDVNLYLYRFKSVYRENWIKNFYRMMMLFMEYDIRCVAIYDTKAPKEKLPKQQERKQKKLDIQRDIDKIKTALDSYRNGNKPDPLLVNIMKNKNSRIKKLMGNKAHESFIDEKVILNEIEKKEKQIINVSYWETAMTKKLLEALNILHIDSDNEAETLCSYLCVSNQVYGVLSNDTDVLAYGSPKFITNLDIHRRTCVEIDYNQLLQENELSSTEFRDFCIMCGTDYNKNIPRIGPIKSYQYIKKFHSIEGIKEAYPQLDTEILKYERVREIFEIPENIEKMEIPEFVPLDLEKIRLFAEEHNLIMSDDCRSIVRVIYNKPSK